MENWRMGKEFHTFMSWKSASFLMQTKLAKLSIFMSLVGYVVLFSDVLFSEGHPTFSNLGLCDPANVKLCDSASTDTFFFSSVTKWQMIYFALISLTIGRISFSIGCPNRLNEHGFSKANYVQSAHEILFKSEYDAMFERATPSRDDPKFTSYDEMRRASVKLVFPEFNAWDSPLHMINVTDRKNRGEQPIMRAKDDEPHIQEIELRNFLSETWGRDYELAIFERPFLRISSILTGGIGYCLLAIPSLDLMTAVLWLLLSGQ